MNCLFAEHAFLVVGSWQLCFAATGCLIVLGRVACRFCWNLCCSELVCCPRPSFFDVLFDACLRWFEGVCFGPKTRTCFCRHLLVTLFCHFFWEPRRVQPQRPVQSRNCPDVSQAHTQFSTPQPHIAQVCTTGTSAHCTAPRPALGTAMTLQVTWTSAAKVLKARYTFKAMGWFAKC